MIKILSIFSRKQGKKERIKRILKNPSFSFSLVCLVLFGILFFGSPSLAQLNYFKDGQVAFSNMVTQNSLIVNNADLFFSQNGQLARETPDLKIIENSFIASITTPTAVTTQTLGAMFGGATQNRNSVEDYTVEIGDTISSIAQKFDVSEKTIAWANGISVNAYLRVGQNLVILPVSGVIHIVASGDSVDGIAKKYKAKSEDIVSFNSLANEGDIFVGDILIIPNGVMPQKSLPLVSQVLLPGTFFIYPVSGVITQGLHYFNAVDIANKTGTPVHAAASGVVQRAKYGWNFGGGSIVTIKHSNGVVTYYGHLGSISVSSGDEVYAGQVVGFIGTTGITTGPHLHFDVIGAKNPFAGLPVGTKLEYK